MKILLTGGTGLVGTELGIRLVRRGDEVTVISRNPKSAALRLPFPAHVVEGDLSAGPVAGIEGHWDAVVHLMGENVGESRWTADRKLKMRTSRIASTKNLIQSIGTGRVSRWVGASAVGIYGDRGEEALTERSAPAQGFLADLCQEWEAEQLRIPHSAVVRLGFILDSQSGGLPRLLDLFQQGLGAEVGSGEQWMAWIHKEDVVRGLLHLIDRPALTGAFNLVAPHPVRNSEFTEALAHALNCFVGPRVPKLAVQTLFGEMSTVVLSSQQVRPERLIESGYEFCSPDIHSSLKEELSGWSDGHRVFKTKQFLPVSRDRVFDFFANARNLQKITPPSLDFKIIKMDPDPISEGALIDYRLKLYGIPFGWQTRIEQWRPPFEFSDIQLKGPYQKWHHVHQFESLDSGTLMTDWVNYKLPLGLLGRIGGAAFVKSEVASIFEFRRKVIAETFAGARAGDARTESGGGDR